MKPAKRARARPVREDRPVWIETVLWWVVATMVFATPIVLTPAGKDMFRLPKELLFRGGWIALLTLVIVGLLQRHGLWRREDLHKPAVSIALICLAWTIVATMASTNPRLSAEALFVVCGSVILFLTSLKLLPARSIYVIYLIVVPALLNAVLAGIQEWTSWRPIQLAELEYDRHLMTTGLMGNPNDVGALLVGPVLLALAGSFVTRGAQRLMIIASLLVLLAGLLASRTLTAIIATAVGVLIMNAVISWKRAVAGAVALSVIGALILTLYAPMAERAQKLRELITSGDYNALVTNRLTSFRAAEEMFRAYPLTGIGPGTFGWHYHDYKLLVQEKHPGLALSEKGAQWSFNFGEVHNDHLEIAAETGFPGWLLYMTTLGFLASHSFRRIAADESDVRSALARLLALPLASAFAVLTLAQFPLQLAATRTMILFLAALCISWSTHDDAG
ncbi:MAG TPA: O-antigen ligase family protein [Thermoanaerobaculia bacterium]|nr:O-antigen ligase family protein [Thermoanaerobaculia bacterium]